MTVPVYVGVAIGSVILICAVIILVILLYKRGTFRRFRSGERRSSSRRLFIRGFSTVTQRGAIDSTAEFEIVNTMSVSSNDSEHLPRGSTSSKSETPPKKPERRRTKTSLTQVKYENVAVDEKAGFVISESMNSSIPYIDTTLESRISEQDEDSDEVFH